MNILIDLVPDSVEIEGIRYGINSDFRIGILFELLMQDNTLLEEEKIDIALNLYYEEIPHDIVEAVNKMLWFYRCGKDMGVKSNQDGEGSSEGGGTVERIYSFEHDDDYIYSAFLTQYNIDLQDIEYLHWWKFRALFKSLKEDNLISKIMSYRSMTINNDMTDSEKKYYRKMKELYKLPDERTEEQKERDFNNAMSSMF